MSIRQGPELDRWLMRIKDLIQIVVAVGSALYVGYKFIDKVNKMDKEINQIQYEISISKELNGRKR
jgi:hypothetical protein